MSSSKQLLPGLLLAGFVVGCTPPPVEPELVLSASPRTIDGKAQMSTIRVTTLDDQAKPGTGTVRITSTAGTWRDGVEVPLESGEGAADFGCTFADDPSCTGVVRLTAEWVTKGTLVSTSTSITVTPQVVVPPDAGTQVTTVTASPTQISVGSGMTSDILATYVVDGAPEADAALTLTTSQGNLLLPDGGPFGTSAQTDSAGEVRAVLADNGIAGVATVTATGPRGDPATVTVRFFVPDAGPPVDGGYLLNLATDKSQIIAGVGDPAVLTATVSSLGVGVPAVALTFVTTIGRLGPAGGSTVGGTYLTSTDDAGVARAQLIAGSTDMGQASVTAQVDGGVSLPVTINIVNVSQIGYVSTECPQTVTNCNLMGLQGSGFNETALVKFKVTDGAGAGVSGVLVTFQLIGAPTGTSVDPTGVTNSMGEVRANVRAGLTIGTFSVNASALGMFSVTSPTIGVRGAKASNNGFSLRCDKKNIAAMADSAPPFPMTVVCTVALTDRYGNPVGTGTQVRLNSEAGTVPNNVTTAAYAPNATNEGFGTFTFNTVGPYPPRDVEPFAADLSQFPNPRQAEPFVAGALTQNPRDGLVTIIAYLQGEEHFSDENQNGLHEPNEQWIDQGEPFVDSNDNNVRDVGEPFIDTPPSDGGMPNGVWDGPNGIWDSDAQIWTEYRLLYSGWASATNSMLTLNSTRTGGGSFGTVLVGTSITMALFSPDQNLNRVEAGAGVTARFSPATRGSITVINNTSALDGYGFAFQRLLVNAAGTGPCSSTELTCRWKILMESWSEGRIADIQLTAGTAPAVPTTQSVIAETTVRGVTTAASATGTVE